MRYWHDHGRKRWGPPGSRLLAVLTGVWLVLVGVRGVAAIPLAFRLKPGSTYAFEVTSRLSSEFSVFENRHQMSTAATGTISIKVLGARQGVFIIDLWEGENHTRRFLKPDGSVAGAPGEEATRLPFFWTLPAGDWQPGQKHRVTKGLANGRETIPAAWDLTLREFDAASGRARIEVAGTVALPANKQVQRSIEAKGTIFFNVREGCFDQGEWTLTYQLAYANKEIAVQRDLWKVQETRVVGFRLKGVTND